MSKSLLHNAWQLKCHMVLLWDRFLAHKANKVQSYIRGSKTLHSEFLPRYAPELNPIENVWGYMKRNPMANDAPYNLLTLTKKTRLHGSSLQKKQILLRSFVKHTPLFLRLK